MQSDINSGTTNSKQNEDTGKLIYGMVYSLKSISKKLSYDTNSIKTIATGRYRLHILMTASNLWFVLFSDLGQQDLSNVLQYIYSEIYVKFVANNFLSPIDFAECKEEMRGQGFRKINNKKFIEGIDRFLGPLVNN